ncbi:hypothetical protein PG999_003010 [Apiospora kogelbergensis]|uniref:Uncharacterized protein n=1 Tax=Apiospora kogelbergensis TaxID=1337665 RepID=A0AAW0R9Z3_9PEZI
MDSSGELERFYTTNWSSTVESHKSALAPDDREVVDEFLSFGKVVDWVIKKAPPSVERLRPALSHLKAFTNFSESIFDPILEISYLWGSLACLLMVGAQLLARVRQDLCRDVDP